MEKLAAEDHTNQHSGNPQTPLDHSVDELSKGLASGTLSRGKALRMLGAALVGATLASIPGAAWAACRPLLHKCTGNFQCCSRNCIKNPQGNGRICGCPTGKTLCGGNKCVSCPAPRILDTTTCACECPAPTPTYCAATNTCVNTQTDPANCGGCGNRCPAGQGCVSGTCLPICPALSCCCSCVYVRPDPPPTSDATCTGPLVERRCTAQLSTDGNIEDCRQFCRLQELTTLPHCYTLQEVEFEGCYEANNNRMFTCSTGAFPGRCVGANCIGGS